MKTEAITKIEDGRKAYKGNRYGQVMAPYVAEILKDFCQQNEEEEVRIPQRRPDD